MNVEHSVKVFPLDQDLESNIKAMSAEGWIMLPGVVPVAIYHVLRMVGAMPVSEGAAQPFAQITIDDTKVPLIRDGQPVDG